MPPLARTCPSQLPSSAFSTAALKVHPKRRPQPRNLRPDGLEDLLALPDVLLHLVVGCAALVLLPLRLSMRQRMLPHPRHVPDVGKLHNSSLHELIGVEARALKLPQRLDGHPNVLSSQQLRLTELEDRQRNLEDRLRSLAEDDIPDPADCLARHSVAEDAQKPLSADHADVEMDVVEVLCELRQVLFHEGFEDTIVNLCPKHRRGEVVGQQRVGDVCHHPERVLLPQIHDQQDARDEVHALAVPDLGIVESIRVEHPVESLNPLLAVLALLVQERVPRESPVQIQLKLLVPVSPLTSLQEVREHVLALRLPGFIHPAQQRPHIRPELRRDPLHHRALEKPPCSACACSCCDDSLVLRRCELGLLIDLLELAREHLPLLPQDDAALCLDEGGLSVLHDIVSLHHEPVLVARAPRRGRG
eukprot:CAMPEP_0206247844 /NCGR_PEP_ID=MMETSP0047_2-20121206/20035_1 /ASSEMBLY_ACC=CAM_ASM_000192 /TAXON_ID=195065 /ORGANISM="Chroomonas mesostigmatica_cf, Strain CCMP1168" /LENGTH=417 /DNA_ID=CAMNT_0053673413 /DNA_START=87 /DNA_END=1336 /DNA_ORIENTATION=-